MRVLFYDTESTDLAASWGRILCASFASIQGDVYSFRGDIGKLKGDTEIDDSKLCLAIRDELEAADMIVGWNSKLHDVPLLNARLAVAGERAVRIGERHGTSHLDLMWYSSGASMKIGGRSLATVSRFFGVVHSKTALDGSTWQLAGAGNRKATAAVVEHCEADVLVLRDLWDYLAPYVKNQTFTLSEVYQFVHMIPSRVGDKN